MSELQILCRMCDNSVNKAVHALAAILLVRLVGQPPKHVKKLRFAEAEFCLLYADCTFNAMIDKCCSMIGRANIPALSMECRQ